MNLVRPCLSCGKDAPAAADACPACGGTRLAHAAATEISPAAVLSGPRRGLGSLALGGLALAALVAVGWWYVGSLRRETVEPALQWGQPEAVVAWAEAFLVKEGAPSGRLHAEVVGKELEARRVIVSHQDAAAPLPLVLRSMARLLVAARQAGPESAAHLGVVRHGDATWVVPVGEAALLATSAEALARTLGMTEEELGLEPVAAPGEEATAEAPVADEGPPADAEAEPAAVPASASGAAANGATGASGLAGLPADPSGPAPTGESGATGTSQADPGEGPAPPEDARPAKEAPAPGPPIRVARGNGSVPTKAEGGKQAVLLRAQVAAGARRELRLRSVTVRAKGTLAEVDDIAWVDLWRDTDLSGRSSAKWTRLGDRQSFTDDDGTVTFDGLDAAFGSDGLPLGLVVTIDLEPDVGGGTIDLGLLDAASVLVEDEHGRVVPVKGPPVRGPRVTVDRNIPVDEEQARLDALAEAGPDAIDPNVERMKEEAQQRLRERQASGASGPARPPEDDEEEEAEDAVPAP